MTAAETETGRCQADLDRIYDYLDGVLSQQELQELQEHLAQCQECAKEYDLECLIRSVVKRSCCEQAPSDLKNKILGRLEHLRSKEEQA
ncbi:MAG: mycothiol system anti-sigma-R factor [Rothia sp. (in: high G+C Gram-positive bacteria)]|nr:mycothiol system anti-sigma-R factor [Rothia sp. (in: high G+C Gram-positive bacteria)]